MRRYLAFDIEIAAELPDGLDDWRAARPLGITCAATLTGDSDDLRLWYGKDSAGRPADRMSRTEAAELARYLSAMAAEGYTILTWNGLGFDLDILAEESGLFEECKRLAFGPRHVDLMFHVFCKLGYPIGLDKAAQGMRLPGKPQGMNGALAPRLWARGERQKVLDYVAQDVRTTLAIARAAERQRELRWITRRGRVGRMPLPRGWLSVPEALALPEPDTSWMSRPWPRSKFTAWGR